MDEYEVAACDLSRKVRVPFAHPAHHPDREQWAETERVDQNAEVDRMVPTRDPVTQCGVLCCRMGQPVSEGYLRRKKDWRNYYAGELDELFQPDGVGVTYCGGGPCLWASGKVARPLASSPAWIRVGRKTSWALADTWETLADLASLFKVKMGLQ